MDRSESHAVLGRRAESGVAQLELAPPPEPPAVLVLAALEQVPAVDFEFVGGCSPWRVHGFTLHHAADRAAVGLFGARDCQTETGPWTRSWDEALAAIDPPNPSPPAHAATQPVAPSHDPRPQAVAASPSEPEKSLSARSHGTPGDALQISTARGHFVVQAGVFDSESNARSLLERLRGHGIEGVIVPARQASGHATFHVVLGRFATWRDAERARLQLSRDKHIEVFSRRLMPVATPQIATL